MALPMPRAPPVTSATWPSKGRFVPLILRTSSLSRALPAERVGVAGRGRREVAVDALHQSGEHVARPDLQTRRPGALAARPAPVCMLCVNLTGDISWSASTSASSSGSG